MLLPFKTGAAHGQKILAALKGHFLRKGHIIHISRLYRLYIGAFVHGVGSGKLRSLFVLNCIGKNRAGKGRMEPDPFPDGKHFSL